MTSREESAGFDSRSVIFRIDYPPTKAGRSDWSKRYSLNAIYSGKHYRARMADKTYWHNLVRANLKQPKMVEAPVSITFWWNDGLDLDNHAYMGKMIMDALKGTLLKDDARQHLTGVSHRFHDEPYILVEVAECTRRK